jgi:hypothetical protein
VPDGKALSGDIPAQEQKNSVSDAEKPYRQRRRRDKTGYRLRALFVSFASAKKALAAGPVLALALTSAWPAGHPSIKLRIELPFPVSTSVHTRGGAETQTKVKRREKGNKKHRFHADHRTQQIVAFTN